MTDICVSGSFAFRCLRREADLMVEALSIVALIHHCCRETSAMEPVGFEWAVTCSRPRLDDFGGGGVLSLQTGSTMKTPAAACRGRLPQDLPMFAAACLSRRDETVFTVQNAPPAPSGPGGAFCGDYLTNAVKRPNSCVPHQHEDNHGREQSFGYAQFHRTGR
jgi:hypothetical protein